MMWRRSKSKELLQPKLYASFHSLISVCERSPANGLYHYKAGGRFTAAFTFNGKN